jgi:hypothetical protein
MQCAEATAFPRMSAKRPDWRKRLLWLFASQRQHPEEPEESAALPAHQELPPPLPALQVLPVRPAPICQPDPAELAVLADQLWGEGFVLPGGIAEVTRLANLLPLSPATTLLLLGADAGGAAAAIAAARGAWVAAQQEDPALAERAALRLRPLGRRATVTSWDPAKPFFRPRYHHHAMALEPLRRCPVDQLVPALAAGLKPGGQMVLLELVQPAPADGRLSASLERWAKLEGRSTLPAAPAAMEAALAKAGFSVNVREDMSAWHCGAVLTAWQQQLGQLRQAGQPSRPAALALITEAERWLLRLRLLQAGCLQLLRWHATRGPDGAGAL